MSVVLLISDRSDGTYVTPRSVHLRDRVVARVHAFGLDRALARGVAPESSPALELRAETLIGPAAWQLGEHVRQILHLARSDRRFPIHTVPICRRLVRDVEPELTLLAQGLLDDQPVDVRGVARVRELLCDGRGPLYGAGDAGELRRAVSEAIVALEIDA